MQLIGILLILIFGALIYGSYKADKVVREKLGNGFANNTIAPLVIIIWVVSIIGIIIGLIFLGM